MVSTKGVSLMAVDTSVLLYGQSILMAGIEAQLHGCPELAVVAAWANRACLPELIDAHRANVLLYDMSVTAPDLVLPLLRSHPDLIAIGMDPSSDHHLLLTGRSVAAGDISDLLDIVRQVARER
jgi:hypothetical protein